MKIEIQQTRYCNDGHPIFDLILSGHILAGASSQDKADHLREALEGNNYGYLRQHLGRCASPLELVAYIRDENLQFAPGTRLVIRNNGLAIFCGNTIAFSTPFNYLILDLDEAHQIRNAVPEIIYRDERTTHTQEQAHEPHNPH